MITAETVVRGRLQLAELAAEHGRPLPQLAVGGSVLLGTTTPASALRDATAGLIRYGVRPEDASQIAITGPPPRQRS